MCVLWLGVRNGQLALVATVHTAGFEAFRKSDACSLELRHEGKEIHGIGQKVKTGLNASACGYHPSNRCHGEAVDPVIALLVVKDLSAQGLLSALRLPKNPNHDKSADRQGTSPKCVAKEGSAQAPGQRYQGNQSRSHRGENTGHLRVNEYIAVVESLADIVCFGHGKQCESATAHTTAQIHAGRGLQHLDAHSFALPEEGGLDKPVPAMLPGDIL